MWLSVNSKGCFQNYTHSKDHSSQTADTFGFKGFTVNVMTYVILGQWFMEFVRVCW